MSLLKGRGDLLALYVFQGGDKVPERSLPLSIVHLPHEMNVFPYSIMSELVLVNLARSMTSRGTSRLKAIRVLAECV